MRKRGRRELGDAVSHPLGELPCLTGGAEVAPPPRAVMNLFHRWVAPKHRLNVFKAAAQRAWIYRVVT